MKSPHTFLCTNGECLCELTMSVSQEDFDRRFYFKKTMPCPICARGMYEVNNK